jgi:hypothetical protein
MVAAAQAAGVAAARAGAAGSPRLLTTVTRELLIL